MKKIFIADDDKNILMLIQSFLKKEGYDVKAFENGNLLYDYFTETSCDLIILDIMMPGIDGLTLCTKIREKSTVPIIIVSAKDSEIDRITGITIGSDDYLTKPFSPLELVARVKALFRRNEIIKNDISQNTLNLSYHNLILDTEKRLVKYNNDAISLTPMEFDFLVYLIKNQDKAISKQELLNKIWLFDFEADTRVADDLVKRLRKKLAKYNCKIIIQTVWGFGYRINWEE